MHLAYPDPPLSDDVVALRPWRDADAPAIVAGFRDLEVDRFIWARVEPYGEADAREYLARQGPGAEIHLAIVEPGDDAVVLGGTGLHPQGEGRAAVGYWVAPEARGRGGASHAVRLVARWAFDELGFARLEITCGPENVASQRVAERCGFVREGVLRSHVERKGERRDSVVFGLLPGELR